MPTVQHARGDLARQSILSPMRLEPRGRGKANAIVSPRTPATCILFDAPLIVWIFVGHAEMRVLAALGALAIVPAILVVLVVRGKIRVGGVEKPAMEMSSEVMNQPVAANGEIAEQTASSRSCRDPGPCA